MKKNSARPGKKNSQLPAAEATLRIEDIAFGGDGIGRVEAKIWFVPFVAPGELVRARARKETHDYVKAELIEVLEPSAVRVRPPCELFGSCGGCSYQHLRYEEQLKLKHRQVLDVLRRIGRLESPHVRPVLAMPNPFGYRNRITVHISEGRVGFHRHDGRGIIEVRKCLLAQDEVNERLANFRSRKVFDGHRTLRATHCPADGFRQTNDWMAACLRDFVCEQFAGGGGVFLDVFGGAGFFAKSLRDRFEYVVGIDWSEPAIEAARTDAHANECYMREDAAAALRSLREGIAEPARMPDFGNVTNGAALLDALRGKSWAVSAVVDPPATGLGAEVRTEILKWNWNRWVYVSCNPATMARDLAALQSQYELLVLQPFDMFPQTAEIEVAAVLKSKFPPPEN